MPPTYSGTTSTLAGEGLHVDVAGADQLDVGRRSPPSSRSWSYIAATIARLGEVLPRDVDRALVAPTRELLSLAFELGEVVTGARGGEEEGADGEHRGQGSSERA